jgi:hypothetical protein
MTEQTITNPDVWQDEDGMFWYGEGHLDRQVFFAACEADDAENGGYVPEEAETEALRNYMSPSDVSHLWFCPDPTQGDPDRQRVCNEGDPGAEPWTRMATP